MSHHLKASTGGRVMYEADSIMKVVKDEGTIDLTAHEARVDRTRTLCR